MFKKVHSKLIFLIIFVSVIFIAGLLINRVLMNQRTDELFSIREKEKNDLFDRLLALQGKSLEMFAYDYTFWDDMVKFISEPEEKWATENIDNVIQNFNVQFVWTYDADYGLVYSCNSINRDEYKNSLFTTDELKQIFDIQYFNHFYINTEDGIIEVRTAPIQPSSDYERNTAPQGYFIAGRLWSTDYIEKLSKLVESRITIISAKDEQTSSKESTDNSITIKRDLTSWDNSTVKIIKAVSESDVIIDRLENSKKIEFIISLIFTLCLTLILYVFMYKWVSSPLKQLSNALSFEDAQIVRPLEGDKTEFGTLAKLLNEFLEQKKELVNEINEHIKTKELLEKITSTSPALITVFDIETEKNIYQNRSILGDLGYPADNVEKIIEDYAKNNIDMVYREDMPVIDKFYAELPNLKDNVSYDMEYRMRDYQGNWQWIRRIYSVFHRDDKGYPSQIVSIFENISKRKAAEESLRVSESRKRALLEAIPDLMFVISNDGTVIEYKEDKESRMSIHSQNIVGQNIKNSKMNIPEIRIILSNIQKSIETREVQNFEFTVENLTASKYFEARMIALDDKEVLTTIRDITARKTAEKILRESEEKFKLLTETVPAMILIYQDSKIVYSNQFASTLTGIHVDELTGASTWEIGHEDIQKDIRKITSARMNGNHVSDRYEFKFKTRNGIEKWMDVSSCTIDYKGKIAGLVTAYDITERKSAEIIMQNSRNFYLSLFDNLPTLISRTGIDRKCDYFNKTWLDFRGVTLAEEINKGWANGVHPDDIEPCDKIFNEAFDKRIPFRNEFRLKHNSGEYHWMVDIGRPFYDIDGQFAGYIGTCFDINEEKKLEKSLKISEEYYRNLFESAHDAIIIFRPDNEVILDVNEQACRIYGFSKEEMIGMSLVTLSEDAEHGKKLINYTLDKSSIQNLNTAQRTKSGSIMFIESNAAVINYKGEKAILAINRDVTAKKRAEDQILSSLKEKEVLIKEVHHRVKNNLQIISSLLKLQSEYIIDQKDAEIFRESQNRVKSMALIHEKLYRSHDLARIDFGDYIQNLVSTLFFTYGINSRKIRLNLKTEKVYFDIDTAIPCGLLVNELVSNCIKHAFGKDDYGEITIEVKSLGNSSHKLVVQDNGCGIPGDIDYKNTKTLGMQLVVTLAEQLDATIELDNCSGTKFTITFKEQKYKER